MKPAGPHPSTAASSSLLVADMTGTRSASRGAAPSTSMSSSSIKEAYREPIFSRTVPATGSSPPARTVATTAAVRSWAASSMTSRHAASASSRRTVKTPVAARSAGISASRSQPPLT